MTRAVPTAERAYRHVKARILEGELAGGARISEGMVSEELGISRTPVREAFLRLESEGLLRLYPKRGAVVVPVSAGEVESVLEARELIETFAAEKVSALGGAAVTGLVIRLREQLEEQAALRAAGDGTGFVTADQAFHQMIVRAADNPFLMGLYTGLRDRQQRMGLRALVGDRDRLRATNEEHIRLVDLIEQGDLAGYRAALRAHLGGTRAAVLRVQAGSIQPSTGVD